MWHRPMLCVEDAQFTVNPAAGEQQLLKWTTGYCLRVIWSLSILLAVYYSQYDRLR